MKLIHFNGSDETMELIYRTINSVNQLSVHGAVANLCGSETQKVRESPERLQIWNQCFFLKILLLIQLLRLMSKDKETCYVNMIKDLQNFLNKKWSNSAPMLISRKNIEKLEFFITFDDVALDNLKGSCREYTLMNHLAWMEVIIKDVMVWRSWSNLWFVTKLLPDFVLWTESTNTEPKRQKIFLLQMMKIEVQDIFAKGRPRPTQTLTLSPVSIPSRERKWIDVEPGTFSQGCFEVKIHGQIVATWW